MDVAIPKFTARMNTQSNATPGRSIEGILWGLIKEKL